MTDPRVVRSTSFDPFRNLAIEDCLFRTAPPETRTLYLWVNDPVVVIGRYQNPWLECRLDEMARSGVTFARRQSGGGAVYHDRGNLCVTFMGPRSGFDRKANIAAVVGALKALGATARANERNDVLADGRKVSGSAYRETADRSFHHLTLLVNADLDRLSRFLQPTVAAGRAKGTASVRSPVANLGAVHPGLTVEAVAAAIAESFAPGAGTADAGTVTSPYGEQIGRGESTLKSWEWRFGGSPEFSLTLDGDDGEARLELEIKGGTVDGAAEHPGRNAEPRGVPNLAGVRLDQDFPEALRAIGHKKAADGDAAAATRYERWARESERFARL